MIYRHEEKFFNCFKKCVLGGLNSYKGGLRSYPMMLCDKVYYQPGGKTPQAQFMMEALEQSSSNSEFFLENSVIYLHCCTMDHTVKVIIPSLPFLSLNALFATSVFLNLSLKGGVCLMPVLSDFSISSSLSNLLVLLKYYPVLYSR